MSKSHKKKQMRRRSLNRNRLYVARQSKIDEDRAGKAAECDRVRRECEAEYERVQEYGRTE